jgi:methanethiol oxidase
VTDPHNPREAGSARLGGIVERAGHPAAGALTGGPQMVEVSRDGRRVYLTNSLYASWDKQFYPDGIDGWLVKLDAPEGGGLELDPDFYVEFDGRRPHQVRLQGGDASSDSYCFP